MNGTTLRLGCLYDLEADEEPPSSPATMAYLAKVATKQNTELIIGNYNQLKHLEYDALFIRQTTSPDNAAHKLAQDAENAGLPVIDDPASIEASCDKIEMHHRFLQAGVRTPATIIVEQPDQALAATEVLGWPLVLKAPDSCFSRGVTKVNSPALLPIVTGLMPGRLVAQEYLPTAFDWRVGTLGGEVLYCIQYRMARGHWQIIKRFTDGHAREGGHRNLRPNEYPSPVCELALQAAACVGNGLYGVDIKDTHKGLVVIEVNDNPSIDHGIEDRYVRVWERIIAHFRHAVRQGRKVNTRRGACPSLLAYL